MSATSLFRSLVGLSALAVLAACAQTTQVASTWHAEAPAEPPAGVLVVGLAKLGGPGGVIRQSEFFLYTRKDRQAVDKCRELGHPYPQIVGWIRADEGDLDLEVGITGCAGLCYSEPQVELREAAEEFGPGAVVGLLATDGTLRTRLYHEPLEREEPMQRAEPLRIVVHEEDQGCRGRAHGQPSPYSKRTNLPTGVASSHPGAPCTTNARSIGRPASASAISFAASLL